MARKYDFLVKVMFLIEAIGANCSILFEIGLAQVMQMTASRRVFLYNLQRFLI